jgi:predicted amidohydrolase
VDAVDVLQHMASLSKGPPQPQSPCSPSHSNVSPQQQTVVAQSATAFAAPEMPVHVSASSVAVSRLEPAPSLMSLLNSRTGSVHSNSTNTLVSSATVNVCALQLALRPPTESPLDALLRVQRQMEAVFAMDSVDLFVLPELAPIGYSEDTFAKYLPISATNQAMYQEFDRFFQVTARKLQSYISYGTIGWSYENMNGMVNIGIPRLFIRQIVVDRLGTQIACYDKTYLCNYGACAESRFFQPGPASIPTSFPVYSRDRSSSFRFGLLLCSDMRYPNLTRTLAANAEHRVDCILQPTCFSRDCSFRTWSSFRETRAMENSVFWIGVNYSGNDYGETSIVPPFVDQDHEPITLECEEGYVIGRVSRNTLDYARTTYPFYRNLLLEESMKLR